MQDAFFETRRLASKRTKNGNIVPTVPKGHKDRVTTLGKSPGPPQTPAETPRKPRRDPRRGPWSMPNMTGRPAHRTMEMNGGSSVPYLARTLAFPCSVQCLIGVEAEGLFDYQGRAGIIFPLYGGTFGQSYSVSTWEPSERQISLESLAEGCAPSDGDLWNFKNSTVWPEIFTVQYQRAQRLTFWVRRPPGGVGVFRAKGGWPKTSCPPSEVCLPWVSKGGIWDVPEFLPGCPGPLAVFKKFVQKKFVSIFRSLQ